MKSLMSIFNLFLLPFLFSLFFTFSYADNYPSDSCNNPRSVSVPGTSGGYLVGNGHAPYEEDFFTITAPSNGRLHIWSTGYDDDLDAFLYDDSGCSSVVAQDTRGANTTHNIDITHSVTGGTTYKLKVRGWKGNSSYTLHVELVSSTSWVKPNSTTAYTHPQPYQDNIDITTTLSITGATQLDIVITGNIEYHNSCIWDYLVVTDEGGNTRKFCGAINETYTVTGSSISLYFHSDGGVVDTGVQVSITTIATSPPTMANIPDQTAEVDTPFTLNISSYVTEPDGNAITYSATGLPPGLTINAGTGIISGTPTVAGTFNVTATATDTDGSASDSFNIIVSNPLIVATPNTYSTTPGVSVSGNLITDDTGNGADSGTNIVALTTVTNGPSQGTVTIDPDGTFTYTPSSSASGTDTFTYTITDGTTTASALITINIGTEYGNRHPFDLINPDYTRNIRGNYKIAGNTVLCLTEKRSGYGGTCSNELMHTSNNYVSKYIDIDDNNPDSDHTGTWNSSSSYIELPDTYDQRGGYGILWAGLFWQGRVPRATQDNDGDWDGEDIHYPIDNGNSYTFEETGKGIGHANVNLEAIGANRIKLKIDTGTYQDIMAKTLYKYGPSYGAFADVTEKLQSANLAKGTHNFTVANLMTAEGREHSPGVVGGWSLVVIYAEDFNGQPRNISVYSGFDKVNNPSDSFTISGFMLPSAGDVHANLSLFSGEGEYLYGRRSGYENKEDWIKISNGVSGYKFPEGETMFHKNNVFDAILDGITREDVTGHANNQQVNNVGVDIDNFDVSDLVTAYRDNDPDINTMHIQWSSDWDYITPSMMVFATELYVPKLCYDYTLDIGGYVLDSEDNEIITPFGGYGVPLTTHLFVRSLEGDIDFTDVNISYSIDDINQLHYVSGSTEIAENGQFNYQNAGTWTTNETNKGFSMYIGTGKTATSGGIIAAEESRYIKLDSEFLSASIDTHFNFDIHYNVNYGSGAVPMHKRFRGPEDLCPSTGGFNVTYGLFNVVDGNADNSNPKYNLFTQVSGRAFDLKVFAHDVTNPYELSHTDLNLSVEVEMIRADDFIRNFNTTCANEHSVLDKDMSVARDRAKFVHIDGKYATLSYDAADIDFAYRSLAMRVWYFVMGDGSLVDDHECTRANQAGCETLFDSTFSQLRDSNNAVICGTECASGGTGCYDCLRSRYAVKVCSRDNFTIRPEAFLTNLLDSQESENTADPSRSIMISKTGETNDGNLVAGYKYRFDINATSQISENAVPKYIQHFTNESTGHLAQMVWNGPINSTCNDVEDKNISFNMYEGSTVNEHKHTAQVGMVDQIGEYLYKISDINWTSADWDDAEMIHHTTGINSAYFRQGNDCLYGSNITTAGTNAEETGCEISSVHTGPMGTYTTLDVQYYPYTFNVAGLTTGAGPTNDNNFVYINTLDRILYPNGIDEDMSYNIQGTFRAAGYTGDAVSNFVDQCYADDVNMTLQHAYLSDIPTNGTHDLRADLIDHNTTNPSLTYPSNNPISDRRRIPFNNILTKNVETGLTITQNKNIFVKDMQGAITMDLGFNFDRDNNTTLNPRRINFSDFNITYVSTPTINVDMKDDYQIFGNKTIDANITFLYARAKPGKVFYDDVTDTNIFTPVSVVVYCDRGYAECQNRGIMALDAQTNEDNWWKSWDHDNIASNDGNIELLSTPASALNRSNTLINSQGEDRNVNVSRGSATLPAVVPVNLVVNDPANPPAPANYTDRWLIYNPESATTAPLPFYRVRFIGGSGWAGYGDTGNVVGGTSNVQKNRRLEW